MSEPVSTRVPMTVTVKPATKELLQSVAEAENATVSRLTENLLLEALAARGRRVTSGGRDV